MRNLKIIGGLTISIALLLGSCGNKPQPKAYRTDLSSDDSMTIRMGQWDLIKYHSDKLGLDINYPSFLHHQPLPSETCQEIFIADDISISVIVDSLNGMNYSAGQQMMGMGADLGMWVITIASRQVRTNSGIITVKSLMTIQSVSLR